MLLSRAAVYCRWLLLGRQLREDGMCDVIVWFVVELASTGVPKNVDTFHVTTQKLQDAAADDRTGGSDSRIPTWEGPGWGGDLWG